jgi:hypothetical protein
MKLVSAILGLEFASLFLDYLYFLVVCCRFIFSGVLMDSVVIHQTILQLKTQITCGRVAAVNSIFVGSSNDWELLKAVNG